MLNLTDERDKLIYEQGQQILKAASEHGVLLRLLGAISIRLHSETARKRNSKRHITDLDFMARSSERARIEKLFAELGYVSPGMFNKLHGAERLKFLKEDLQLIVDIFFGFHMCHSFDFSKRLHLDPQTLSVSDLLITKLQIVQQNEKDLLDIIALVGDHELSEKDEPEHINMQYIGQLCGENWPIWKTFTITIDKVLPLVNSYEPEPARQKVVANRLKRLREAIDSAPRSLSWKMRARVGERVRWYEEPTVI